MPTAMERIAASSAKSPAEYRANKKKNDEQVRKWRDRSTEDNIFRINRVKKVTKTLTPAEALRQALDEAAERRGKEPMVLMPVPAPIKASEPPADLVDYSLVPVEATPPWEGTPPTLFAVPPIIGTMMVMLGKRMLVSMAITGLSFLAMEPLQQYGKGLPRANVLWHTGRSNLRKGSPVAASGTGYVEDDPGLLEAMWAGASMSWDMVKAQWKDPASWFWWVGGMQP